MLWVRKILSTVIRVRMVSNEMNFFQILQSNVGLEKICFFFFLFFFSFMLDKSTYFAFPIHPFCSLFLPFCFPKIPFLHTVIKVQAKIRESNEQGVLQHNGEFQVVLQR